ncbi:MAG: DUF2796 domain-containing protein [Deltaproteobacteria bacterium]|jgi:hypothetical protein|nr:DUF2796 domain-containing protein [Deltaproteobacteria bacterium]
MIKHPAAILAFAPLLFLLAPSAVLAQGETHAAHVHGAATLNVTVEAASVDIDLDAPLASFISFEHAPSTPEQTAEMKGLVEKLNAPAALFAFPAAWGCSSSKVAVEAENIPEDVLGHPHAPEGEGHGHDHGEADGDHEHAEGEAHSDLEAEFEFACTAISGDGSLDASGLFKAFPNLQDVDVQLVSPKGQKGAELNPAAASLTW